MWVGIWGFTCRNLQLHLDLGRHLELNLGRIWSWARIGIWVGICNRVLADIWVGVSGWIWVGVSGWIWVGVWI